jgi:hypothetical protein
VLADVILFGGLAIIAVCSVAYAVIAYLDRSTVGYGPVPDYNFDINEHQNYWEADSR